MGDPTTYMVSNNPIASAFGGQDDEFFSSIGQENSGPSSQHMNMTEPQMYTSDGMQQQFAQYSVYDQPIVGDQETYLPGQGPDTRHPSVETEGIMNNSNSNPIFEQQQEEEEEEEKDKEGQVDSQLPKVSSSEEPVPPPPTSFQNQQHTDGFESISSVRRQPGAAATQSAFAPPQSFGYGVAQPQAHQQSVEEEEDGVSSSRESVPKVRLNPSLEAGRRKLEEFKRKKAAVLSRRSSITSSQYNDSGVKSDVLEARLQEAQEEIKKMKSDVQRLTEEVEASREEKQGMEREKAALLGELVSIKASVEDSGSSSKAIELLREELDAMKDRTDGLEASLASSRAECNVLSEEKARLEDELNTLKVNSALTMRDDGELDRVKIELESLKAHHASLQSELEHQSVQATHLQSQLEDALNQEQGAREELEEAKDNIDSLRELLSEGEQERVELASHLETLKLELAQMKQVQQQEHVGHTYDDAGVIAAKDEEIRMLKEQLIDVERSAAEWREKAQQQVSAEVSYQQTESAPVSPSENALQVRLAKAEAAVESERRAYQDLQQKTRDMENAIQENATLNAHMTELRQKEEYLEQQIQILQAQLHDRPSSGGHPGMMAELEQRASTAENKAHSLEMELAEASSTITRLSGEVNDLINRLKEQSGTIVELRQKAEVFESVPINDAQPPAEQSQLFTPPPPPPAFHEVPIQQQDEKQREEIVPEQPQQSLFDTLAAPPQQQSHPTQQPWSVPGGEVETFQHQERTPDAETSKKKVGFWQWVAGADLASHE